MTTLFVRDVPDDVAAVLKESAAAAGQSLCAYVTAQLSTLASRPTNADVETLRRLPRTGGATTDEILAAVQAARR